MKKQKFAEKPFLRLRHEEVEINKSPSMTRPEQVRPLDVLLNHRDKGMHVPYFNGVFSEQETPDIYKLDFVELAELRETTQQGIEAAEEDLHALNKRYEELKHPKTVEPPKQDTPPEVVPDKP